MGGPVPRVAPARCSPLSWRGAAAPSSWQRGMLRVVQAVPPERGGGGGGAGPAEPGGPRARSRTRGCGRLKEPFVAVPAFPEPEVSAGLEGAYCRRAGPGRAGCIPAPPPHAGSPSGPGCSGTGARTAAPAALHSREQLCCTEDRGAPGHREVPRPHRLRWGGVGMGSAPYAPHHHGHPRAVWDPQLSPLWDSDIVPLHPGSCTCPAQPWH